ncbi:MAG: hypothetical protein NT087_06735 [Deltaproteobacteria bacterium]|nr:hypothetical protein [Deltaproteobacteria bacterium]
MTGWGLDTEEFCRGGELLDAGNLIPAMVFCKEKILCYPTARAENSKETTHPLELLLVRAAWYLFLDLESCSRTFSIHGFEAGILT